MEKIIVVSGSHRAHSESDRVARYISTRVQVQGAESEVISLSGNPLPLWDEGVWEGTDKWKAAFGPLAAKMNAATGFIIVSPEWAGMVPPGLKNFLLLCGNEQVAHKPAMIVAVSSGIGGSYPVAELRSSSYKNNRIVYIPDHIIVRSVGEMLKGETAANHHDESLRKRIDYSVVMLLKYATALTGVRSSGLADYKSYPFGM